MHRTNMSKMKMCHLLFDRKNDKFGLKTVNLGLIVSVYYIHPIIYFILLASNLLFTFSTCMYVCTYIFAHVHVCACVHKSISLIFPSFHRRTKRSFGREFGVRGSLHFLSLSLNYSFEFVCFFPIIYHSYP